MTKRNENIKNNLRTCPSCGTKMLGIYCHNCSEKRIASSDYSLSKFLKQSINFLTHYDSKFIQSARILVSRPGFLTKEYFAGRRVTYVKPLQLFFLLNLLFLLLSSIFNWPFFTTPLVIHLNSGFYSFLAKTMVDNKIHELGISYEEYQAHFNHVVGTFSKTLVFKFFYENSIFYTSQCLNSFFCSFFIRPRCKWHDWSRGGALMQKL